MILVVCLIFYLTIENHGGPIEKTKTLQKKLDRDFGALESDETKDSDESNKRNEREKKH